MMEEILDLMHGESNRPLHSHVPATIPRWDTVFDKVRTCNEHLSMTIGSCRLMRAWPRQGLYAICLTALAYKCKL
jgi:hypothetical protein